MAKKSEKRSFGYNTTALATAPLVLEDGIYAGILSGAAISGKEDKQYINIVEEQVWDKNVGTTKTGKSGSFVKTGDYIIEGSIFYGATLTSKKAITTLQRDEPKVFGGRIKLAFDKETLSLVDNHVLGSFLAALGIHEHDFSADVDFEYNEAIEVPEELAHVPNIVDMLNSLAYQRAMFTNIVNEANHQPIRVSVAKQPNYKDPSLLENVINTGRFNSSCGILAYVDGCENDLEG